MHDSMRDSHGKALSLISIPHQAAEENCAMLPPPAHASHLLPPLACLSCLFLICLERGERLLRDLFSSSSWTVGLQERAIPLSQPWDRQGPGRTCCSTALHLQRYLTGAPYTPTRRALHTYYTPHTYHLRGAPLPPPAT